MNMRAMKMTVMIYSENGEQERRGKEKEYKYTKFMETTRTIVFA